jgi:hypothetical protein
MTLSLTGVQSVTDIVLFMSLDHSTGNIMLDSKSSSDEHTPFGKEKRQCF